MTREERLKELADLWTIFNAQGGRGVELADRIDALEAELASLPPCEKCQNKEHGSDDCPWDDDQSGISALEGR